MPRYSVEFAPEFDQLLTEQAKTKRVPKSEIIRRAVASYAYLTDEEARGGKISITDKKSNKVLKDVVLP